jgi:hypothetical protein
MEDEKVPTEEKISLVYKKCGKCHVVSIDSDFEQIAEGILVCPVCGAHNVSEDRLELFAAGEVADDEGNPVESVEKVSWTDIVAPFDKSYLDKLDEIKKKKADLEKEEKKLAPKVKDFLVSNKISEFPFEGHKMVISYQDRSTMDEDKLVALLKEVLTEEEIETLEALKQISNPAVIPQLLTEGKLTVEQLASCKIPNIISVFNLNPKPRKEKSDTVQSPFGGML